MSAVRKVVPSKILVALPAQVLFCRMLRVGCATATRLRCAMTTQRHGIPGRHKITPQCAVNASRLHLSTDRRLPLMLKALVGLLIVTMPLFSQATEEPAYDVVQQLDGAEVRQYKTYVVAQVLVTGPAEEAGSQAFPILAGYIFGKNKSAKKFEMTAPVTQVAEPVKLDMTAPVTQTRAAGGYVVQFVLPKEVTLASAPEPLDPRVQLREVPSSRVAVIRYSGLWSQSNYDEHLAKLQSALRAVQMTWTGQPTLSRYDPPFTPWFMRRNEIWLTVQSPAQRGAAS